MRGSALLAVLQLSDSGFPSGRYTLSHGLEAFAQSGLIETPSRPDTLVELLRDSIRFGIGRFNSEAEVDYVADRVIETVERLRELSPLYEMAKEGINLKDVKWAGE